MGVWRASGQIVYGHGCLVADDVTSPHDVTLADAVQEALRLLDAPELFVLGEHVGERHEVLVDGRRPASLARRTDGREPRRGVHLLLERQTAYGQRVGGRGFAQQQEQTARETDGRRHGSDDQVS